MRWSQEQLDQYLMAKTSVTTNQTVKIEADLIPESKLQEKVERYLREKNYYFFHDRSRGVNKPGHPDIVAALPGGRVLWLELKTSKGKMSKEQKSTRLTLLALEQKFYEIRSFKAFLEVINL